MSFWSCTFNDGVFALKLDFSFMRPRLKPTPTPSQGLKKKKRLGARPLPPPFPLPPMRNAENLLDAPLLADVPPMPTPSVIVDDVALHESPAATLLMDEDDDRGGDAVTRRSPSPLESPKTDLMQQRRDVRRALRRA